MLCKIVTCQLCITNRCIFINFKSLDELLQLHLEQIYCSSKYGISAIRLTVGELSALNFCWHNACHGTFMYPNAVIEGLGFLNFTNMVLLC